MSSTSKKHKAKNSYIHNGGEKNTLDQWKMKRVAYFTKSDRILNKKKLRDECNQEL